MSYYQDPDSQNFTFFSLITLISIYQPQVDPKPPSKQKHTVDRCLCARLRLHSCKHAGTSAETHTCFTKPPGFESGMGRKIQHAKRASQHQTPTKEYPLSQHCIAVIMFPLTFELPDAKTPSRSSAPDLEPAESQATRTFWEDITTQPARPSTSGLHK